MNRRFQEIATGNVPRESPASVDPRNIRDTKTALLVCLLLGLVTLAAFWPVRQCQFVDYDDQDYVTENSQVRSGLTWPGIARAFQTTVAANWHPLTWLSHMLDCQLYGLNPAGHHVTNLLLHVASALLLFLVLRRMTTATWRSAFVAALFAVHPLHVESVAWVAERKDVLSTFFFMLTLWAYVRYVEKFKVQSPKSKVWYAVALICFVFGLMSKPMLVTLPFVLLLLDYWPLRRLELSTLNFQLSTIRRLLLEKLPFFLLTGVFSMIAFKAQRGAGAVSPASGIPIHLRLENALISYSRYLKKTFWPDDLAVFYPHPGAWPLWQVVGAGVFLAAVSVLVLRWRQERPYLLAGWLWFLGMLVPVIGLVQVGMQSMADRYAYVPLIGVFIMLAWLTADLTANAPRRALVLWPAATAALVACLMTTQGQLRYWQNTERLFEHALRVTMNNDVAHNSLGVIRYRQGKIDEAIAHFREAIRLRPSYTEAQNNLGGVLSEQGHLDEALTHLRRALELNPNYASAYNNLGMIFARQGRTAEAVTNFETALRLNPDQPGAHNNLGTAAFDQGKFHEAESHFRAALRALPDFSEAHQNLAMVLAASGRIGEAIAEYEEALRLKPDLPVVRNKLGSLLLKQGKFAEAGDHFLEALRLKPDYADAHSNLGLVLARQDKLDEAIAHYQEALRYETNHVAAHNNLGLALVRQGQLDEAVKHFSEVVRFKPNHAEAHNKLGVALARQGKFSDALAHFNLAMKHGADPAEAHNNMGRVYSAQGEIKATMEHYRKAIHLRPDEAEALNNLAWVLATHPEARYRNGTEAIKLAERAAELAKGQDAGKLDTLAAAYAEVGKFTQAIETGRRALEMAEAAGQKSLANELRARLQLYQAGQPHRE